eukprot:COSAG05_NODE_3014_length_2416_cov_1.766940_1_plen_701_part_00
MMLEGSPAQQRQQQQQQQQRVPRPGHHFPWRGHGDWMYRRGRGLVSYIYVSPAGLEFDCETAALQHEREQLAAATTPAKKRKLSPVSPTTRPRQEVLRITARAPINTAPLHAMHTEQSSEDGRCQPPAIVLNFGDIVAVRCVDGEPTTSNAFWVARCLDRAVTSESGNLRVQWWQAKGWPQVRPTAATLYELKETQTIDVRTVLCHLRAAADGDSASGFVFMLTADQFEAAQSAALESNMLFDAQGGLRQGGDLRAEHSAPLLTKTVKPVERPDSFEIGDIVAVRCGEDAATTKETHSFWVAQCRQRAETWTNARIKIRWWEAEGYPLGILSEDTRYTLGFDDTIEVFNILCLLRSASQVNQNTQLSLKEYRLAAVAARAADLLFNKQGGKAGTKRKMAAHNSSTFLTRNQHLEKRRPTKIQPLPHTLGSGAKPLMSRCASVPVEQILSPCCGGLGEWCNWSVGSEFDVQDERGRWYAARVGQPNASDDSQSVRLELCAWDGLVKAQIFLPRQSDRIRQAGSQSLVSVDSEKEAGQLCCNASEVSGGRRIQVKWHPNVDEWYSAVVVSRGQVDREARRGQQRHSSWTGWFRMDFDGFDTGMQFFDISKLTINRQLRLLDDAEQMVAPCVEGTRTSDPVPLKQEQLKRMCVSTKLTGSRVAVFWASEQQWFRGRVLSCTTDTAKGHKFFVRYDDGAEQWEF